MYKTTRFFESPKMYQVFVPGIFFNENVKRSFENVPGFRYQVGESTRLKVPRPGTFLQNLVKNLWGF